LKTEASPEENNQHRLRKPGIGERVSSWVHQGEWRSLTADTLTAMDIVDVDRTLIDVDDRIETSKRRVRRAGGQLALASYPWLVVAPFGLLIALKSRAAIRQSAREAAGALPDSLEAQQPPDTILNSDR
jgi:hypothetical protein